MTDLLVRIYYKFLEIEIRKNLKNPLANLYSNFLMLE
jgi:hypothetical protein